MIRNLFWLPVPGTEQLCRHCGSQMKYTMTPNLVEVHHPYCDCLGDLELELLPDDDPLCHCGSLLSEHDPWTSNHAFVELEWPAP